MTSFLNNPYIFLILFQKPVGVFHLLDDESNFPKASDLSFLEKALLGFWVIPGEIGGQKLENLNEVIYE